jgi:nitrous oxide reductase accessory protein NosL
MIDGFSWRPWCHRLGYVTLVLFVMFIAGCYAQKEARQSESGAQKTQRMVQPPQLIPDNVACGKCGMIPARYPQWQTQIIFTDGSMVPFDGCKCMFGYLFNMAQYDKSHTRDDVATIWVKDFNSGSWIQAPDAQFVVGSDAMGPMGKELIPFSGHASALAFQQEHGGSLTEYGTISMETLKPLMGGMNMQMKMKGKGM